MNLAGISQGKDNRYVIQPVIGSFVKTLTAL
jgi:hypothetical protein